MTGEQDGQGGDLWDIVLRPPWRFLASGWPWRALVYLSCGALLGPVTAAVILALLVLGIGLLVVGIGLLALVALAQLGIVLARWERARLRLVDARRLDDPHVPIPAPGVRAYLTVRLHEQVTWRELGYAALNAFGLCWVDLGILAVSLGVPALVIGTPFYSSAPDSSTWYFAAVGVLLLPAGAYLLAAWAAARATLVRGILGPQQAELGRRLAEVAESRARLSAAFERERRGIERDLHDGAQRHLVAVSMSLGMARLDLPPDAPGAGYVEAAHRHAERALAELRALIRGVHPKVLTDRGLPAAVEDIAGDLSIPVQVQSGLRERLPSEIESTAYFCVAEALTNVARHSGASRARVTLSAGTMLTAQVFDDGRGGAVAGPGSGITGVRDRLAAVDGTLDVVSPAGGPTTLTLNIPLTAESR